jgi:hypothetical protein
MPKPENYNLKNYHRENVYSCEDPGLLKTKGKSKLCMEYERGSGSKRTDIRQGIDRNSGFFEDNFDKRDALWAMPQTSRRWLCPLEDEVQVYMCDMAIW